MLMQEETKTEVKDNSVTSSVTTPCWRVCVWSFAQAQWVCVVSTCLQAVTPLLLWWRPDDETVLGNSGKASDWPSPPPAPPPDTRQSNLMNEGFTKQRYVCHTGTKCMYECWRLDGKKSQQASIPVSNVPLWTVCSSIQFHHIHIYFMYTKTIQLTDWLTNWLTDWLTDIHHSYDWFLFQPHYIPTKNMPWAMRQIWIPVCISITFFHNVPHEPAN